jgi:two-component system cell cycle sensor histidine kinase/response regulator CckA
MTNTYRVLIIDDDFAQAEMVSEFLGIAGYQHVDHTADIHTTWLRLSEHPYDIILLDYRLPDGTGLELLDQLTHRGHQIPVVMVTGQGNERIAVQAIQHGAADYLLKSGDYMITLPALIHKTIQAHQLKLSILRTQEQIRYQATLLNNVRDAIVVWDLAGRITYWNPAAEALFGCAAEERLGLPVANFYLSVFNPPIIVPREGETGGTHVVRQFISRDGKTLWVSSRVTTLHDDGQPERPIGYMDVSHDITRSIQAEQALRESEARYRAIVEDYQTELICRYKPNGMLTFANEVYCRYFGKGRDELIGMNFLYFIPENERPKLIQHLGAFSSARPVGTLEHQINLPGQGLRWLQRTDRAIFDDHGRIFEFQSVGRDITDRKALEAQIQAAQIHLVHAARLATIGEVASGVAHQIYNPLTTIIADAQILLRQLPASQPGRDSAEAIEQAGWRLQKVVQRLLEFTRPATEALSLLSVNETIQSALSLVHASIESLGGQLEAQLSENLPRVRGNAQQLESLWVNLLLLARDAVAVQSTNDHPPTIRVISRAETPAEVKVEIRDNGRPIPVEQLATVFEPNFVGPTSGRGTGMELSICREIVRQHGGQIAAECAADHDTIILVSLPAEV